MFVQSYARIKMNKLKKESLLYQEQSVCDYIDSYEYLIADPGNIVTISEIAELFILPGPAWIEGLLSLRNKIVSVFGLKTAATIEKERNSHLSGWENVIFL